MVKTYNIQSTRNLPEHDRILQAILNFFSEIPGVIGSYVSGSTATGRMDEDSDLDVGVVFGSQEAREASWEARWDWEIVPWFHRFDADHIKPYFVIYFYEPQIKADINLYLTSDLPPFEGGPYEVVIDDTGALKEWWAGLTESKDTSPDWSGTTHEDEQFWAWMVYLYNHVHRGEYYHSAYEFPALRDVLEKWIARLGGSTHFDSRYLEDNPIADPILENDLFPKPDRESLKFSMLDAIEAQLYLRRKISASLDITWKTSDSAIEKIENLVRTL
jgi:predicted nucleotidyltransferase